MNVQPKKVQQLPWQTRHSGADQTFRGKATDKHPKIMQTPLEVTYWDFDLLLTAFSKLQKQPRWKELH